MFIESIVSVKYAIIILSLRFNEPAMVTGPAGPNPQHRLASGRLKTDEQILINKNTYFDDGKPVRNRLVLNESGFQRFDHAERFTQMTNKIVTRIESLEQGCTIMIDYRVIESVKISIQLVIPIIESLLWWSSFEHDRL